MKPYYEFAKDNTGKVKNTVAYFDNGLMASAMRGRHEQVMQ